MPPPAAFITVVYFTVLLSYPLPKTTQSHIPAHKTARKRQRCAIPQINSEGYPETPSVEELAQTYGQPSADSGGRWSNSQYSA